MRSPFSAKPLLALGAAAAVAIAVSTAASPASAQDIVVGTGGVAFGEPGTMITVATEQVPEEFVGVECEVALASVNNESVHPGNNLFITTGGTTGELQNVEGEPGEVEVIDEFVTLGEEIVVELEFGADGVTSGGLVLAFECAPDVPEGSAPEPEPAEPEFAG